MNLEFEYNDPIYQLFSECQGIQTPKSQLPTDPSTSKVDFWNNRHLSWKGLLTLYPKSLTFPRGRNQFQEVTFHRSLNELVSEQKFKTEVSWPLSRASLLWFDSSKVPGHLSSSSSDQSAASYLNVFLHLWTGTKKYLFISYFQTFSEENKLLKERRGGSYMFISPALPLVLKLHYLEAETL